MATAIVKINNELHAEFRSTIDDAGFHNRIISYCKVLSKDLIFHLIHLSIRSDNRISTYTFKGGQELSGVS
jgi:hypothetical protein